MKNIPTIETVRKKYHLPRTDHIEVSIDGALQRKL